MDILVVDNGTYYLSHLTRLLKKHHCRIIRYSEIDSVCPNDFDAIILSGGHDFPVSGNQTRLQKEIDLVKKSKRPIFGICFGYELIATALGAKLRLLRKKEKGIADIQVVAKDKIFNNIDSFQVFENHRWVIVRGSSDNLKVLARSRDGIEIIKHKSKSIYGVQFHPEMFVQQTCGDEILNNFLNLIH